MEFAISCEDLSEEPKTIHVLELVKDEFDILHRVVEDQLKTNGIPTTLKRRNSRSKTRKSGSSTPGTPTSFINSNELVPVKLNPYSVMITIPRFLKIMVQYIKLHLDEEGLFRKAGACTRISALISSLNDDMMNETVISLTTTTVFDACTAMKQLLRKLDDPLIPFSLHHVFIKCLDLPQTQRADSMLLAVLLLPKENIHILLYLMDFLYEVTQHADKNKMDAKNLAIVLAPNIMPTTAIPTKYGKESGANASRILIQKHVEVITILIEQGYRIGIASNNLASALVAALCKHSEDELESEGEGVRKRKRSASLNRVFDFLRKKKTLRNSDTPGNCSTPFTPGHTPVIHTRKGRSGVGATPMSTSTKNRILSAIQKKGLTPHSNATPNMVITFRSPGHGICLNPRPAVTEAPPSVQLSKLPRSRMSRSMIKNFTSKSLDESNSNIVLDRTKSGLSILPLAKSPRSRMPLCATPSVPDLETYSTSEVRCSVRLAAKNSDERTKEEEALEMEALRLTPMLREINVLTQAALDEEPCLLKPKDDIKMIMDKKGRICRRVNNSRPPLILPKSESPENENKIKKPEQQKHTKVHRSNSKFVSKLQSPKKISEGKNPTPPDNIQPHSSYVASKLKREADGTINIRKIQESPKTPYNRRRQGRSRSMRSTGTPGSTPRNHEHNENIKTIPTRRSMRRGISVQELVKKFDNCKDEPF